MGHQPASGLTACVGLAAPVPPGTRRFETREYGHVDVVGLGSPVRQYLDLGLDTIGGRACRTG